MILALDVGFGKTGWAVFDKQKLIAVGCIVTEKTKIKTARQADDNARRAASLAFELKEVVGKYNIQAIIGELPSGGALSAKAMQHMALSTGVVTAVASVLGLPTSWTTPSHVKMAVCENRSADKKEMMNGIVKKFPLFSFPKTLGLFEHIADACGAYLALRADNLVLLYG